MMLKHDSGAFLLLNETIDPKVRQVDKVYVPESRRREGIGTELLREACMIADRDEVSLRLTVREFDGPDEAKLIDWYRSLGFEGSWLTMERRPR